MLIGLKILYFISILLKISAEFTSCNTRETCSECIQELNCIWCILPKNMITLNNDQHCISNETYNKYKSRWCEPINIISAESSQIILENRPLSSDSESLTQIKPQRFKLKLRKGETVNITFKYVQAKDYPVDLYYLMDFSHSMISHKDNLAKLGGLLAKKIRSTTKIFKLGFGSFIDKVTLPFTSTVPIKLIEPCKNCSAPYSYKHHLSLIHNDREFTQKVAEAKLSGNLDHPEGGFDALLQAIVCKDVIGWTPKARHLLVFSTDAVYHSAGDGRLGGIVEPHDGKCHMKNNQYNASLIFDFPSVSQINYFAKQNDINIIFAVTKSVEELYKKLSSVIENSYSGTLEGSNVADLISTIYGKIVDKVTMTSNSTDDIEIKFSSTCKEKIPNGCKDIHAGEMVQFTASIKLLECPSNKSEDAKYIAIKPGAVSDNIILEIEPLCTCKNCEPTGRFFEKNADKCSNNGDLKCGVCACHRGFFGKNCECDESTSSTLNTTNCIPEKGGDICSNLGICKCGRCICNSRTNPEEKITGKFCECNNYSCKRENGIQCSGKGTCNCGNCECHSGWEGDACQCSTSMDSCIAPYGEGEGKVCSGHGSCICGRCDCSVENGKRYSGKYCEDCTSCPAQRCQELKNCVECKLFKTGLLKSECEINCTTSQIDIVNQLPEEINEDVKRCLIPIEHDCTFEFDYSYDQDKNLIVKALKNKKCKSPPNILAWVLGVVGSILLGGIIALIVWKITTTIHDRREYIKFENERKNQKWHRNENPLYTKATTTFNNPTYGINTPN